MEETSTQPNTNTTFLHSQQFRWMLYGMGACLVVIILWGVSQIDQMSEVFVVEEPVTSVTELTPEMVVSEREQFEARAKAEAVDLPLDVVAAERAKFQANERERQEMEFLSAEPTQ